MATKMKKDDADRVEYCLRKRTDAVANDVSRLVALRDRALALLGEIEANDLIPWRCVQGCYSKSAGASPQSCRPCRAFAAMKTVVYELNEVLSLPLRGAGR